MFVQTQGRDRKSIICTFYPSVPVYSTSFLLYLEARVKTADAKSSGAAINGLSMGAYEVVHAVHVDVQYAASKRRCEAVRAFECTGWYLDTVATKFSGRGDFPRSAGCRRSERHDCLGFGA